MRTNIYIDAKEKAMNTSFEFTSLIGNEGSFARVGFVRIRDVIPIDEVEVIRGEIKRIIQTADQLPKDLVWFSPSTCGGYVVQRISRINRYSHVIDKIGKSHPRLHRIASRLLGSTNIRYADGSEGSDGSVLVIKHSDNASEHRELRWHRDAKFTQHLPINPFINLGIYLDDCTTGSGELVVLPESHRLKNFQANTGDVVIHSSELWHCSRSHMHIGQQRRVLYFNYHVHKAETISVTNVTQLL
jgi:hypothetical protein